MKFPSLFKAAEVAITTTTSSVSAPSCRWQRCTTIPKTFSFRATTTTTTPDLFFTMEHQDEVEELEPAVVSGLRSERLFYEPGETNSILEEAAAKAGRPLDAECMSMESLDPVLDFSVSMVKMVEAGGRKDWEFLEELLKCYLQVNHKRNHFYIVEAFADLLIRLAFSSNENPRRSFTSPLSFTSSSVSPCWSSLPENEDPATIVNKNGGR